MNFYFLLHLLLLVPLLGFLFSVQDIHHTLSQQVSDKNLSNKSASVKITSHSEGEKVPVGKLTISGISNDDAERNCIVYIDWNDKKPFQQVRAAGPGGIDDFSEWFFTYDTNYNTIIEGKNDLTSKITCTDIIGPAGTKWYSVNLIGVSDNKTTNSNQKTLSTNSLEEPSYIITPGFTTKSDNSTLENNRQNLTNRLMDEPSQKIIPGSISNFKDQTLQNNSLGHRSDLVNESSNIVPSRYLLGSEEQNKTNFLGFNYSNIKTGDIVLTNETNSIENRSNDSEIRMINDNITRSTAFNNNKSINTLSVLESIQNNTNPDNDINPATSTDLTVFVTLPESVIINNNYSSELLVLYNNSLPVANAILTGEIYNLVNPSYKITFLGKTDSNGTYNFPLNISDLFPAGAYNLKLIVTKSGITDTTFSAQFSVSKKISLNEKERSVGENISLDKNEIGHNNIVNKFSKSTSSQDLNEDKMTSLNNSTKTNVTPFELNQYPTLTPPTFEQPPPTFEQPPPTFEQPPPTFEQPPPTLKPEQQGETSPNLNPPKFELPSFFP